MSKVIGIVGSRNRDAEDDLTAVRLAFESVYQEGDSIVSGGCPQGGDRFAEVIAKALNLPVNKRLEFTGEPYDTPQIRIYLPQWKLYGRAAGFVRNKYIANDADILIACVKPNRIGGTEDTIRAFKKKEGFKPESLLIVT